MGIGGNYTQVQLLGRPHPEGVSFFFTQLGVRAIEAYALDGKFGLQFFPKRVFFCDFTREPLQYLIRSYF